MFMPKQTLHTHEEVFKDHVTGQYDETIFRFRVPGGWIYTHTIIRFGSVDKNFVADTFVPGSALGAVWRRGSHQHPTASRLGEAFKATGRGSSARTAAQTDLRRLSSA